MKFSKPQLYFGLPWSHHFQIASNAPVGAKFQPNSFDAHRVEALWLQHTLSRLWLILCKTQLSRLSTLPCYVSAMELDSSSPLKSSFNLKELQRWYTREREREREREKAFMETVIFFSHCPWRIKVDHFSICVFMDTYTGWTRFGRVNWNKCGRTYALSYAIRKISIVPENLEIFHFSWISGRD